MYKNVAGGNGDPPVIFFFWTVKKDNSLFLLCKTSFSVNNFTIFIIYNKHLWILPQLAVFISRWIEQSENT